MSDRQEYTLGLTIALIDIFCLTYHTCQYPRPESLLIAGNLKEVQQTLKDLIYHLNLYRDRAPETELADLAEDIDLDYIIEDLPKMIDSMLPIWKGAIGNCSLLSSSKPVLLF